MMITKINKFLNRKQKKKEIKTGDFFISRKNNIGKIIAITSDSENGVTYYASYDYKEMEGIDNILITYPIKYFGTKEEMEDVLKAKTQAKKYNIL